MQRKREQGNASIGAVIGMALAGLLYLQSAQQDVTSQVHVVRNAKLRTDSNEAALYALSVASQLLSNDDATDRPRVAAENIVDPNVTEKLRMRALMPIPNGAPVSLDATGSLLITTPVGGKTEAVDLNQLFTNQNFTALDANQGAKGAKTVVRIEAARHEPFITGYGIQQVILDASVQLSDRTFSREQTTRALLYLNAPKGTCALEVFADGVKQANGASVPHGKTVTANMACEGVIYSADINVGGASTTVGPLTLANSYTSVVPSLFPTAVPVVGVGVQTILASYMLLDASLHNLPPFTINIAPPPPPPAQPVADVTKCLDKCMYCEPTDPQVDGCVHDPAVPYRKPFSKDLSGVLPWPEVTKPLNGPEDAELRATVTSWAVSKGLWHYAVVFMSLAYPRYGEVLVCQGNGWDPIGWEPKGFDPQNDCEETPVASRGYIGCLDPESLVTVRPGVVVPLRTLRAGHSVYNPVTKQQMTIRHVVKGPEKKAMNRIVAGGRALLLTANHPVLTERGELLASDVTPSDRVFVAGAWGLVSENTSFQPPMGQEVWNITLAGDDTLSDHWFEANGLVVGDLWMQERLNQ